MYPESSQRKLAQEDAKYQIVKLVILRVIHIIILREMFKVQKNSISINTDFHFLGRGYYQQDGDHHYHYIHVLLDRSKSIVVMVK